METPTTPLSRRVLAQLALSLLFLASGFAITEAFAANAKLKSIKHIIVIYQENWSFDSLYGKFPGANGIAQSSTASLNQTDRFDNALSGQSGMPFSLVSGTALLTTPPQPLNAGKSDTRFYRRSQHTPTL